VLLQQVVILVWWLLCYHGLRFRLWSTPPIPPFLGLHMIPNGLDAKDQNQNGLRAVGLLLKGLRGLVRAGGGGGPGGGEEAAGSPVVAGGGGASLVSGSIVGGWGG